MVGSYQDRYLQAAVAERALDKFSGFLRFQLLLFDNCGQIFLLLIDDKSAPIFIYLRGYIDLLDKPFDQLFFTAELNTRADRLVNYNIN